MARRTPRKSTPEPGLFDEPAAERPPVSPATKPELAGSAAPGPAAAPAPPAAPGRREPRRLSVSELTSEVRARLEETGRVAVEGELSRPKRHTSGHVYFDLKDANARISCVVWRSRAAQALRFQPEEGMQVVAHGKLDVYAPRGSYSLIVERLEPLGAGALLAELEERKRALAALGWFERRRALPALPARIGVVTSRDGAALRDFLRTRSLRFPGYPVLLCHTPVQGPGSAEEIADAIRRVDAAGVDVLVVCRGGGSLEDLWAFNEPPVAEAIWNTGVPVVTGVGHETDTTLADLVADHRAHTPTDAAQAVIPDRARLAGELVRWGNYLVEAMDTALVRRAERVRELSSRPVLARPERILEQRAELLHAHGARLEGAVGARLSGAQARLVSAEARLERQSPRVRLERWRGRLARTGDRLAHLGASRLEEARTRLGAFAGRLEGISPLAVLARGYSLTTRPGEAQPVSDASSLSTGDSVETRVAKGSFVARVESVARGKADA